MTRPLHKTISRAIKLKSTGGILIIGKARTLSRQLENLADNHLGRVPYQDVFENEPNYKKGISK